MFITTTTTFSPGVGSFAQKLPALQETKHTRSQQDAVFHFHEGGIVVLLSAVCDMSMQTIPHRGSNPTVCNDCVFEQFLFGEISKL